MSLTAKSVLLLACFACVTMYSNAQTNYPCQAHEASPDLTKESNPTTRDAVVIHSDSGPSNRTITAETCLITGTSEFVTPGPLPQYVPNVHGLYFDWNLAVISEDGRIVDLNGTVSKTGRLDAVPAGQNWIAQPLSLSWNLGKKQPRPSTNRVLTLVGIWPCQDDTSTCSPDSSKELWQAKLLGSPGPVTAAPWRDDKDAGCVAPTYDKEQDPHVRQLTVIGFTNQYVVYTCLVSDKYQSFQLASFTVKLEDKDGKLLTETAGGNTRQNVEKLFYASGDAPNLVTVLAVQITSLAPAAPKPAIAEITLHYIGCPGIVTPEQTPAACDDVTVPAHTRKFEWFQRP